MQNLEHPRLCQSLCRSGSCGTAPFNVQGPKYFIIRSNFELITIDLRINTQIIAILKKINWLQTETHVTYQLDRLELTNPLHTR